VIIPIDSSSFALLGMNQLLKTIAAISETHNPTLQRCDKPADYQKRPAGILTNYNEFFGAKKALDKAPGP
jgi:hypothetical protein